MDGVSKTLVLLDTDRRKDISHVQHELYTSLFRSGSPPDCGDSTRQR